MRFQLARTILCAVVSAAGTSLILACSSEPSMPMGPSQSAAAAPSVSAAEVVVGDVPVQGRVAQGTGEPALFRVRVQAPQGLAMVRRVVLEYSQPGSNHHGGPMMGGFNGMVVMYDDGTHGDPHPGDGWFHFMDPEDAIGCHGIDAPPGDYEYHFWCEDVYGQRSNVLTVSIQR